MRVRFPSITLQIGVLMNKKRAFRKKLVDFVEKYELWFYSITVFLNIISIPIFIWVFPDTSLATLIVVLFTGFTSSVATLATALLTADQNKELKNKDEE